MQTKKNQITYREGYKYQLAADYEIRTGIFPVTAVGTEFCTLARDGLLRIRSGYAWDGASSVALDTNTFMRGSLVHDALYQLISEGLLSAGQRVAADKLLHRICIEDGMDRFRARYVLWAVRTFGGAFVNASKTTKNKTAP